MYGRTSHADQCTQRQRHAELRLRAPFELQMERTRGILDVFGSRGAGLKEMLDNLYGKSLA